MTASFRKINYQTRPAKYAERRMLRDLFRRTSSFGQSEDAQYVGFGSLWFADFILFHRSLGVRNMVSIEEASGASTRFNDNRPFDIDLMMESASKAIPKIDWGARQFVWLDYDSILTNSMLRDLSSVVSKVPTGSIVAITVNVTRAAEFSEDLDDGLSPVERFQENFADFNLPLELAEDDLVGHPFAEIVGRLVVDTGKQAVRARAGDDSQDFLFEKICSFRYSDGAPMITLVGIVFSEPTRELYNRCGFGDLDFLAGQSKDVTIDVPILTARECVSLDAQLPIANKQKLKFGSIPEKDAKVYMRFYRHLPNYIVSET